MIGTQIASYRILEKLGEGGMGTVYKAVDTALDRMVAVKVLSSDLTGNQELVQRFRAEAKAQANLNHTNLATLYAFVVQDDHASMIMEFIDGETFEQIILRRGALAVDDALPLFKQALLGIGYAHRAGIVHRDIKPSNLMVNRAGIVKVMDFGIAKVMGTRGTTRTGVQMGTGWYMSPEQVLNRPVDIRSDIYSLGVTLYQMITAHVPFDGPSDYQIMADQVNTPPPLPTSFTPHIPKGVENAVLKALEKNPDARFQTVEEFGAALEHPNDFGLVKQPVVTPAHNGAPVNVTPAKQSPVAPLAAFFARPERKVMAGGAALAIVLLGGWLVVRSNRPEPTPSISTSSPVTSPSTPTPLERDLAVGGGASEMANKSAQPSNPTAAQQTANQQTSQPARTNSPVKSTSVAPQIARPAQPSAQPVQPAPTKPMTQPARPGVVIMVRHDHGFAPNFWPQCWGLLQVTGNHLQYRVMGTNDGRRDGFDILLSQVQEVRANRVLIRNFPAFHITVSGRIFNFIPQGMAPLQAAAAIQQKMNRQ